MVKTIAAISFVYDVTAGLTLLFFRSTFEQLSAFPSAQPAIYGDLNGIFATVVGIGYLLPYRDPVRYRDYLWVFGVALKTAGALAFVYDYAWRGAPAATMLFAVSDATLALLTLVALRRS